MCLVSSSFYPSMVYGGPIFATWDLSRSLADKGLDIYVSTTDADGKNRLKDVSTKSHLKLADNIFIRYYHEQIINYLSFSFIFNLWNDIKESDVVYIQYIFHYTSVIALFYSFFLRKRVVLCARGSLSSWGMSYRKRIIKKIWIFFLIRPFVKDILWQACSHLESSDIKFYFKDANVEVLYDGVNVNEFSLTRKISKIDLVRKYTDLDFESISEIIFSMGRLHHIKRFDILIDAFSIYHQKNPDAKLLIAGPDDGFRGVLMKKIIEYDLLESVFLIGSVEHEDKCLLLSNSSAFVLPSHFESFGIVVVEALASGLPVIVSNNTPWRDIEKNKFGIFTANNKHSLFNAFCKIKKQEFNSNRLKEFVKLNFDWQIIANRFKKIIQE